MSPEVHACIFAPRLAVTVEIVLGFIIRDAGRQSALGRHCKILIEATLRLSYISVNAVPSLAGLSVHLFDWLPSSALAL